MRFGPAWAYIDGIREFGRFFCEATFGTQELADRACVVIQETLENAVKYSTDLAGFFKALHAAAVADKLTEVRADVSGLTFVNSSAIRLFVDWATWVKSELSQRYTLRFVTNRNVTWQKTSFTALLSLMKEVLAVEQVT